MKVTVLLFAAAREALDAERVVLDDLRAGATVGDALDRLAQRAPALARLGLAFAVNRSYARREQALADGDELALIPPISGGSDVARTAAWFSRVPIDPRALEAEVRTDDDGAVVTFLGVARRHHEGRRVLRLSYEAYEPMALALIEGQMRAATEQFAIGRVRVAHRLGEVRIGETAVAVVVASAHRGPALEACRWLMDRIKHEAPIFKKEESVDGSRWIGEPPTPPS